MTDRRAFLKGCSLLTVAAATAPLSGLASLSRAPKSDLGQIPLNAFARQLNSTFQVGTAPGASVTLKLVEVTPRQNLSATSSPDAAFEKFSLIFRGPLERTLASANHSFEQAEIGRFDLFITPIRSKDQAHAYYEAVFNRPVPAEAPTMLG